MDIVSDAAMSSSATKSNARRRGKKSRRSSKSAKHTVGTSRAQQDVSDKDRKIRELRATLQEFQFDYNAQSRRVKYVLPTETEPEQPPLPSLLNPNLAAHAVGVEARADLLEQGIRDFGERCKDVCQAQSTAKDECFNRYEEQLRDLDQAEEAFRARQEAELCKFEKARQQLLKAHQKQCGKIDDWCSDWVADSRVWMARAQEEIALLRGEGVRKDEKREGQEEELRQELCCPLTHMIMVDPVLTVDGYSYERAAIEQWFARSPLDEENPRCPRTNAILSSRKLIPNVGLKSLCDGYRRRHGQA